jgi:hypothetical protein
MLEDVIAEGDLAVGGHDDLSVTTNTNDGGRADTAFGGGESCVQSQENKPPEIARPQA